MRRTSPLRPGLRSLAALVALTALPATASASLWEDATASTIGTTGEWSNKVELADINGDGRVDILFANGGNYASPGQGQANRVFLNQGEGAFIEATADVLGSTGDLSRVIKVRDVDGDGDADIVVGATYQTQTRLYLGDGSGGFTEVTASMLPQVPASVGDLELGDVDGDGDLDMVLANWGTGNPLSNSGGRTMLWLGSGDGSFTDATAAQMPNIRVRFSWDLEFVDVDNDFDLDVLIACKSCAGSYLFVNDGAGNFSHDTAALPQFSNNYEFEAMDLNKDGALDLITINDGPQLREHVFMGDGAGGFEDRTGALWPNPENVGEDDNMVVFIDADSDGDPDFLIGSLSGDDRLILNDGNGKLTNNPSAFDATATPGTLGIQVADLNGDGRIDVVQSQGELADQDKVFFGVDVPVDTASPVVARVEAIDRVVRGEPFVVRARVHDNKSPTMPHDWQSVELKIGDVSVPMIWYGEYLWRARFDAPDAVTVVSATVCATDAMGNSACSAPMAIEVGDAGVTSPDAGASAGVDAGSDKQEAPASGCGCRTGTGGTSLGVLVLVGFALVGRRWRRS